MNKLQKYTIALASAAAVLLTVPMLTNAKDKMASNDGMMKHESSTMDTEKTIFAGGCFWCMEKPFEKLDGVLSVVSGYSTGKTNNPTYRTYNRDGHLEVVEITYNPKKVSYEKLLDVFWHQINPTDAGGQFVDRGYAYSTGIFYLNENQRKLAEASKTKLAASKVFDKPIITPIKPAAPFYAAEDYHQDYYKKNPVRYWYYRKGSGRDQYLDKIWGEDRGEHKNMSNLKEKLTPLQYKVTQEEGTEPPFDNAYWDYKEAGIYVDIVSGEALFSSVDKFKSGTGWPSFDRPLVKDNIIEKVDKRLFSTRTEVRSKDSHLGHVFNDGPKETTGLRYCINSASLRFIPVTKLEEEGYGQFIASFK